MLSSSSSKQVSWAGTLTPCVTACRGSSQGRLLLVGVLWAADELIYCDAFDTCRRVQYGIKQCTASSRGVCARRRLLQGSSLGPVETFAQYEAHMTRVCEMSAAVGQ